MTRAPTRQDPNAAGLKGRLASLRAAYREESLSLEDDLARAALVLAEVNPRAEDEGALARAEDSVQRIEEALARLERAAGALETLYLAQSRIAQLNRRLDQLTAPRPEIGGKRAAASSPSDTEPESDEEDEPVTPPEPAEPESGEAVIDLQNAMVQRLRSQIERLREERSALIINGRNTLASMIRVHQAVLGLLESENYEDFLQRLNQELPRIIDIPVIVLGIERSGPVAVTPALANIRILADGKVESLFGPQRKLLLRRDIAGDRDLYGDLAEEVRSDALLRLRPRGVDSEAVLAFGADAPDYFDDDQGTELLTFLGRAIETLMGAWAAQEF